MGHAFSKAKNVIVWIGDETRDSSSALSLIKDVLRNDAVMNAASQKRLLLQEDLVTHDLPEIHHADWRAVDKLYWRPWFSRIWIIQEITLAKNATILVGKDEISRADFLSATALIYQSNLGSLTDVSVAQVGRTLQIWDDDHASVVKGLPLLDLLMWTQEKQASVGKDKSYALLGLAADAERLAACPDYGIYGAELFINVAASHLKSGSLKILSANDDICWKTR